MMSKPIRVTRLTLINIVIGSLLLGTFLSPIFMGGFQDDLTKRGLSKSAGPLTANAQRAALTIQQSYINVYRKAAPSVVYIKTNSMVRKGVMFEYYRRIQGAGSGFIIDGRGYIVTNAHVVKGARKIDVVFHDNTTAAARLIGRDDGSDVALIKVPASKNLVPALLGDSDAVEPGQLAFALGAPFGLNRTFTVGTISARQRRIDNTRFSRLQTDASINPGNSGGPLLNIYGQVVGINQSIISPGGRAYAGSVGIGFAIPINDARKVIEQLKKERRVIGKPSLGVQISIPRDSLRKQLKLGKRQGVVVLYVVPGSAADRAGVKEYDFIVSVNGKKLTKTRNLIDEVQKVGVGATIKLVVIRKGRTKTLSARVGEADNS